MLNSEIIFQNNETSQRFFRSAEKELGLSENRLEYRRLKEDFWFVINGNFFVIKAGFWWDGASIPKFLWGIIGNPWEEDIAPGALIHDALYGSQVFERVYSDHVMYTVNDINNMGGIKNHLVYRGLRMGGWAAWKQKTKEQIEGVRSHLYINGTKSTRIDDFSFLYV